MRPPRRPTHLPPGALALLAALVATLPARAKAAPPTPDELAEAKSLFTKAEADEDAGRWSDALTKLRRVTAVKTTPGVRFHIGLCEEKLGHLVAALDDYAMAEQSGRAENKQEVVGVASEARTSLQARVPHMTVGLPARFVDGPLRAEVRLDGAIVPASSYGIAGPVDPGSHTIQAHAPGQLSYALTVTVVERQDARVDILFVPDPNAAPLPGAPAAAKAPPQAVSTDTSASTGGMGTNRRLAIIATAGAGALLLGGVGAYAAAAGDQSYWQGKCAGLGPSCMGMSNPTPTRVWDWTALGAWIGAAGAAGLSVYWWTRPDGGSTPSVQGSLVVGPGSVGLRGQF
jgi:hypothetical protein